MNISAFFSKKKKPSVPADRQRFYVQLHLLDGCNLHCAHCYQDENKRVMRLEETAILLEKLDAFFEGKDFLPQINLTGGEPLLYPDLLPLIDRIRERGWLWALLTNGTLLTPELAEELRKRDPVFVQVSLEGPKELNDNCRGRDTFEKILRAVDLLNDTGIKTLVSFTVTSANYRAFHETAAICRSHRVHKLWCDRYVGNDDLCLSTEQYQEFLTALRTERELPDSPTLISAERSLQFMAGGNGYLCGCGKSLLVFLPDGTILPCRRLELPLGNLFEISSIDDLLAHSDLWKDLSRPVLPNTCIGCPDLKRCQGGAKCVTYAQTGKYHEKDINCPRT